MIRSPAMLGHLKISRRLQIIGVAALAGMVAVAMVGLFNLHDNLIADRKNKVQSIAETAVAILADFQRRSAQGELPADEARTGALSAVRAMRYGQGDYVFILDRTGTLLVHPNPAMVGKVVIDSTDPDGVYLFRELLAGAARGGGFVSYRFPRPGQQTAVAKLSYAAPFEPWGLTVGTGIYVDDVETLFRRNAGIVGAIVLALLALVVGGTLVIARGISRPLTWVTGAISRLADRDTGVVIGYTDRRDEIGDLARALDVFKGHLLEAERLAGEQRQVQLARQRRAERIESFIADFEQAMAAVVTGVATAGTQLQADAQTLAGTADRTNRQSVAVAAAAEQASSNVQTVAAATEELTASVGEISRQVTESAHIADTAVEEAGRTNGTVAGLSDAARKIGDIVQLINDIASQTNLLALNATIEAARAGEAGKGFAVVASEVKNLANQTAKATEDIQGQVAQMQAVTGTAVDAIKSISGTIRRMSEITTTIASSVEQQGAATQEIARNVAQASQGTSEVSNNIGGVTEAAGSTGVMAAQTLCAAETLNHQATRLRSEVDSFIGRVRAA